MIETRTYSAMLYDLADEIDSDEGCITTNPEEVCRAAERLDEQTMAITVLLKAIEVGRSTIASDREALIECHKDFSTGMITDELGLRCLAEYDKTLRAIDAAVAVTKCYGRPEKQAKTETTVPAIIFYPAGSLGEPVEIDGGEA